MKSKPWKKDASTELIWDDKKREQETRNHIGEKFLSFEVSAEKKKTSSRSKRMGKGRKEKGSIAVLLAKNPSLYPVGWRPT